MSKYTVHISPLAYRQIDKVYEYISIELVAKETALRVISEFENAILSLEDMPERGAERKVGIYSRKGYRQLFVKHYVIIYRVDKENEIVTVVSVCHSRQQD